MFASHNYCQLDLLQRSGLLPPVQNFSTTIVFHLGCALSRFLCQKYWYRNVPKQVKQHEPHLDAEQLWCDAGNS